MQTLEQVNKEISFYRNSDYKWERELTTLFEDYFDKEFREFLTDKHLGGMTETEFKEIFLTSLFTLHKVIHSYDYYVGDDQNSLGLHFHSIQHPATKKDLPLNKAKAERLFILVTMPFRIFEMNISKHLQNFYKAKVDIKKLGQHKQSLETDRAKLEGISETLQKNYDKLAEDIQENRRKEIGSMAKSYILACENYLKEDPTPSMLSHLTSIPKDIWKKQLTNPVFLYVLLNEIRKKKNLAKDEEKISFWTNVYNHINKKIGNALKDNKVKKISYSDDYNYEGKLNDSEFDEEEF